MWPRLPRIAAEAAGAPEGILRNRAPHLEWDGISLVVVKRIPGSSRARRAKVTELMLAGLFFEVVADVLWGAAPFGGGTYERALDRFSEVTLKQRLGLRAAGLDDASGETGVGARAFCPTLARDLKHRAPRPGPAAGVSFANIDDGAVRCDASTSVER